MRTKGSLTMGAIAVGFSIGVALPVLPQQPPRRGSPTCPMLLWAVTREVTNIERGVRIRLTSDDPAFVRRIQTHCTAHEQMFAQAGPRHQQACPAAVEGARMKVAHRENGVEVEITADSPKAIAEIQARAARLSRSFMRGPFPRSP